MGVWQLATLGARGCEPTTAHQEIGTRALAASALPPLPNNTALWRIEKLPLAEIKQRLQDAGLAAIGTKRTLAKQLSDHLRSLPPPETDSAAGDDSSQQSNANYSTSDDETTANESPHDRWHRRHHYSVVDRRTAKDRPRQRSRRWPSHSTSCSSSSRSSSTTSYSSSGASSSSPRSSTPSPRKSHRRKHRRSRAARSATRSRSRSRVHSTRTHRHHRCGHGGHATRCERCHRGRSDKWQQAGTLPPIPDKLKSKIRRGEYVQLSQLLHANLSRASGRKGCDAIAPLRVDTITDFASWSEA